MNIPAVLRHKPLYAYIAVGVAALAVIALAILLATRGTAEPLAIGPTPTDAATAAPSATPTPSASPLPAGLEPGEIIATTAVDELSVFASPGATSPTARLGPWSMYSSPLTLLGTNTADVEGDVWLEVLLPYTNDGATGWIRESDVTVSSTTQQVHVYLDERVLEYRDGAEILLSSQVVVGHPDTPTPPGTYYITDPLEYPNPNGVYGAYALGLSGYSQVLDSFEGGPPQLAIHGTNQPNLIGQALSNGCIRLPNDVVVALAADSAPGTPVIVHATRED